MTAILDAEYAESLETARGLVLDPALITQAEAIVCLRIGLINDDEFDPLVDLDRTDRHWIREAIVYETLWLPTQPDIYDRIDAHLTITDGDSAHIDDDGLLLAPLAKWALRRTSYMKATMTDIESFNLDGYVLDTGRGCDRGWVVWH